MMKEITAKNILSFYILTKVEGLDLFFKCT